MPEIDPAMRKPMSSRKAFGLSLSEEEMRQAACSLGKTLIGGEVIALVGLLGAGKTHFTKGLLEGLGGAEAMVTSPTFSLVNEYSSSRLPVYHFDFYRMASPDEVIAIGWEEYLDDGSAVMVVEWADKFAELIPDQACWLYFEIAENGSRNIFRSVKS